MNNGCYNLEKAPKPNAALVVVTDRRTSLLRMINYFDANGKSAAYLA